MIIEHRIAINAPASSIFSIYEKVSQWHTWDPDTKSAHLDGPFTAGTTGKLAPTKGRPITIRLSLVEQDRAFTCLGGIPGFTMEFEHELYQVGDTTQVIHRVHLTGAFSLLLGPLLRKQLNQGLPITLRNLKSLAESMA